MDSLTAAGSARKNMKARIKDFVLTADGRQLITLETKEDFREKMG